MYSESTFLLNLPTAAQPKTHNLSLHYYMLLPESAVKSAVSDYYKGEYSAAEKNN